MAWIRTSLSMIGFGFTIYKFFQYLPEEIANGSVRRPHAPRNLGLTLIALGTLALVAATWQHRSFLKATSADSASVVGLVRGSDCCDSDWNYYVLRRTAALRTLLDKGPSQNQLASRLTQEDASNTI